jgi:hypothetical protein
MSFVRSQRAGHFDDAELDRVKQVMPHLRNAVVLHRELSRLKVLAALEWIPMGVVLLTGSGVLMHANRRAHDLFAGTGALHLGPGGTLHAARVSATTTLQRLIREAVQTTAGKRLRAWRRPPADGCGRPQTTGACDAFARGFRGAGGRCDGRHLLQRS